MKRKRSIIGLIIAFTFTLMLSGCYSVSENKIVKQVKSPNGKYTAGAYIRDKGNSKEYTPQVFILKEGENVNNNDSNVFVGNNSDFIDIKWEDDSTLVIDHKLDDENIEKKLKDKYGIKIKYVKK